MRMGKKAVFLGIWSGIYLGSVSAQQPQQHFDFDAQDVTGTVRRPEESVRSIRPHSPHTDSNCSQLATFHFSSRLRGLAGIHRSHDDPQNTAVGMQIGQAFAHRLACSPTSCMTLVEATFVAQCIGAFAPPSQTLRTCTTANLNDAYERGLYRGLSWNAVTQTCERPLVSRPLVTLNRAIDRTASEIQWCEEDFRPIRHVEIRLSIDGRSRVLEPHEYALQAEPPCVSIEGAIWARDPHFRSSSHLSVELRGWSQPPARFAPIVPNPPITELLSTR